MGEGGGDFRLGRGELSPFFASIFPLFPQKRLILRLEHCIPFNCCKYTFPFNILNREVFLSPSDFLTLSPCLNLWFFLGIFDRFRAIPASFTNEQRQN